MFAFLARAWNISKTTLQRCISSKVAGSGYASERKQYLPEESEEELANLIKLLSKRGFPLTRRDDQGIGFNYAKTNNIKGFSEVKVVAGSKFFLKGVQTSALRRAEGFRGSFSSKSSRAEL